MSRTATWTWRNIVRQVRVDGRERNLPCHLCRGALGPIDYRTRAEADAESRANGLWWLVGKHLPLSLAVDHIVPHAAGGADTLANAAPAHALCNGRAGAKGPVPTRAGGQGRANGPTPTLKAVSGRWRPLQGQGEALAGRAIPGQRTATHVFVADIDATVAVDTGTTPSPGATERTPLGTGHTSGGPTPPSTDWSHL